MEKYGIDELYEVILSEKWACSESTDDQLQVLFLTVAYIDLTVLDVVQMQKASPNLYGLTSKYIIKCEKRTNSFYWPREYWRGKQAIILCEAE